MNQKAESRPKVCSTQPVQRIYDKHYYIIQSLQFRLQFSLLI